MKRKLKPHFNLYSDDPFTWQEEAASPLGGPRGPGVLIKDLQVLGTQPRVCRPRRRGCWLPGGVPGVLPGAGKVAAPRRTEKSLRCSPPSRAPLRAGAYCWDKSALLLAFIFSSRFTKWPLLTSSSSVLSSAERSWEQGGEAALRDGLPPSLRGLPRLQSY